MDYLDGMGLSDLQAEVRRLSGEIEEAEAAGSKHWFRLVGLYSLRREVYTRIEALQAHRAFSFMRAA